MAKHLYFYSDALEWGGQEILAARIANILSQSYQVHFFFSSQNFETELAPSIEKIQLSYHSQGPFPIIRDRLSLKSDKARKIFEKHGAGNSNFKKIIICPGNIERCIPAIIAATKLNLEIISYYPMAFSQKESLAKLGSLRDWLALKIYPKISKWIVNTPYQEKLLRRFIEPSTKVFELLNPLTYQEDSIPKKPQNVSQITTIGRIYFGQKGQEIIPEIAKAVIEKSNMQFHIIGQGPDADKLKSLVKSKGVTDNIFYTNWASSNEVRNILQKDTDILLITSKFESGPMVLFEALQCGKPILAANEDYIKDYRLPAWMTFEPGNAKDAATKILGMPQSWNLEEFERTREFLFAGRRDKDFQQQVLNIFNQIE